MLRRVSSSTKMTSISDLRNVLKSAVDTNTTFCSFELLSGKKDDFYQSFIAETNKYRPLFYALTCHMNDTTKSYLSLELIDNFPSNTLIHLVVNSLTRDDVLTILKEALDHGIVNIFVLRGDSTVANSDFPYAVDLVRFIRSHFQDQFCICVAGYPDMHPKSLSKKFDLYYLKEKVDAGADFIITQVVFEANVFIQFVKDCREIGINVPIIPGILSISNYTSFKKMVNQCNVKVPENILHRLEAIKANDDDVYNYGIQLTTSIIKNIITSKTTCGFHLFTLNRTALTSQICDKLGMFS